MAHNDDDETQERLQVILHNPDQGNDKNTTDPRCGKTMSRRSHIYVGGGLNICPKLLHDSEQILLGSFDIKEFNDAAEKGLPFLLGLV